MADTFAVGDDQRADRYDAAAAAVVAVSTDIRNRIAKKLTGGIPRRARNLFRQSWWNAAVDQHATPRFAEIAADTVDDLTGAFNLDLDVDQRADPGARAVGSVLGLLGSRFDTVQTRVRDLHAQALAEGWDSADLADALALDGDSSGVLSDAISDAIGRSLATFLIEAAAVLALRAADVPATKTWVTVGDERVRAEHAALDGHTVGIDEPFDVGGFDAMWPGDDSLPADLAVNCRCKLEYSVASDAVEDSLAASGAHLFGYSPDQERDERGRWAPSGDKAADSLTGVESAALDKYQGGGYEAIQRASAPDSMAAHRGPDGKFTPERAALHEKLISEHLAGVPSQESPVSYLMGGGVAGGKSNIVRDSTLGIPQGSDAVQLNADSFKEGLPEYRAMIEAGDKTAAAWVHAESAMLAGEAFNRAAANHQPVVLDGTNGTSYEFVADKVATLRENGAEVRAHYVTCDPDAAVARALVRGDKIGRYIPPSVIRKTHEGVARVLPGVMEAGLFDEVTLWHTDQRPVTKIAEARGDNVVVHDAARWDTFKRLGGAGDALSYRPSPNAVAGHTRVFGYNPDQERDEKGRWVPSGDEAAAALAGSANGSALDGYRGGYRDVQAATAASSMAVHLGSDGKFTPERAALHDKIIGDMTAGVPAADGRTSYMMGGGPAAGKSTILDNPDLNIPHGREAVEVNADLVKEALPEYQEMVANGDRRAAPWVHEESSYVAKRAIDAAVANRQPVVLDGTGDSSYEKLESKVERLRENGGRVVGHYATCDPDDAVARMQARAERTGRAVPETLVRGTHESVARVLPEAMEKGLFDEVTLWSTKTRTPAKIAEARGGVVTVHDQDAWDEFRSYGGVIE